MADRTVRVNLRANVDQYTRSVERAAEETTRLERKARSFSDGRYVANLKVQSAQAKRDLDDFRASMARVRAEKAEAKVTADTSEARERLRLLNGDLDRLNTKRATPSAELKIAKFRTEAAKLEAEIKRLGAMHASPDVDLQIAEASARLAVLREELRRFDGKTFRANAVVNVRDNGVSNRIKLIASALAAIGPAAIGAGVTAGTAIVGLTSTLSVFAAGAGVTAAAFIGMGDAIKAAGTYAMDPTAKNAQALQNELKKLNAVSQEFAIVVGAWAPKLRELQNTARAGMFPGMTAGLRELTAIMPNVDNLVRQTSTALGELARQGAGALTDPFWRSYIDFISAEAGPQIIGFGQILGNFIKGLAGMQMAFKPFTDDIVNGLKRMAQEFAAWGTTLGENKQFGEFMDYVRTVGPQVMSTLGDLGRAFAALIQAAAPLAPFVLGMISNFAKLIETVAGIPGVGTALIGLATAIGTLNMAMKLVKGLGVVQLASALGLFGGAAGKAGAGAKGGAGGVGVLGAAIGLLNPRANQAALMSTRLGQRMEEAGGKTAKFGRAASGLAGSLPLIGAALLGPGMIIAAFSASTDDAAAAMLRGGAAAEAMDAKVAGQSKSVDQGAVSWSNFGLKLSDWVASNVFGIATVDSMTQSVQEQLAAMSPLQRAQTLAAQSQENYNLAVERFGAGSSQALGALGDLNAKTREFNIQQLMSRDGLSRSTAEMVAGAQADQQRRQTMDAVKGAQTAYNQALAQHGASSVQARDAELSLTQAQIAAANAARFGDDGARQYALTLGQLAQQSGGNLTPALRNMISELDMTGISAIGAKVSINGVGQAVATLPNGKEVILKADGRNAQVQLEAVTTQVNRIPAGKTVNVGAISAQAQSVLTNIGFQVERLPDGTVNVTARDDAAKATLTAFVNYSNALKANPSISAKPEEAYATMLRFINDANAQVGLPQLQANTAPADQAVNAAIQHYNALTGTGTLDANTAAANQRTSEWVAQANAQRPTPTVDALTGPASDRVRDWNATTQGQRPVPTVDANTGPATGASFRWNADTQRLEPVPAVNANTAPADGRSRAWNDGTNRLRPVPNVDANTGQATSAVQRFASWVAGLALKVAVFANKIGFSGGGIAMAKGGIVTPDVIANDEGNNLSPYARSFGDKKLRNMPGGGARMVAPNSWRVVGDRMDVPELYAPLDGSGRSLSLIAQGASTYGKVLVDSSAIYGKRNDLSSLRMRENRPEPVNVPKIMAAVGAGGTKNVNNYVTVHNPIAERSSDSVQRELSKMADLGLFGDD